MAELTGRLKTIKEVYERLDSGFGSIQSTLQQAKKINSLITYNDVKTYLDKLQHRQTQFSYKSYNSFISKHALYDMEIDLIDMTSAAEKTYRYGFVAVDTFTKIVSVIPLKTKQPSDVVDAMVKTLQKIGVPNQIYSDQEGSFSNIEFIKLMNKHKIKHHMTVGSAHTVENFNRQFKEQIQTRLNALNLSRDKWVEHIDYIIKKHNNSYHSVLQMTPNEATKKDNRLLVSFNIRENAKYDRKYSKIIVGQNVRVLMKKDNTTKGYFPKWSQSVFKVLFIENGNYMINDGKRKLYKRHEILTIPT
jgi:uncharacterized protein YqgV (UPF0045/DUF77 family)